MFRLAAWGAALGWMAAGGTLDAQGQTRGAVRGTVIDADFGGTVPDASVRLVEVNQEGATGADGSFFFPDIEPGAYTLMVAKEGFERGIESGVVVVPGELTDLTVRLRGTVTRLEEFVVTEPELFDAATEMGALELRQETLSFQDTVSKELISQAGASDAAGALRLVAGASVADGKFATIRGLTDRYVGTTVNGVVVPGADPRRRAVQLDLFPAAIIEGLDVQKTFVPELPGDFSGGGVNIRTLSVPDKPFFSVSFSRKIVAGETGKDGYVTYEGGGVGPWGQHRGVRGRPPELIRLESTPWRYTDSPLLVSYHVFPVSRENPHVNQSVLSSDLILDPATRSVDPVMGTSRETVPPGSSVTVSGGGSKGNGTSKWGGVGAFSYSRGFSQRFSQELDFFVRSDEQNGTFSVDTGEEELTWSLYAGFGIRRGDQHSVDLIAFRSVAAADAAQFALETTRTFEDLPPRSDLPPSDNNRPSRTDSLFREHIIQYTERSLDVVQLRGQHKADRLFGEFVGAEITWYTTLSQTVQDQPDTRFFQDFLQRTVSGRAFSWLANPFQTPPDFGRTQRLWQETETSNPVYGVDVSLPFRVLVPDLHRQFLGLGAEHSVWGRKEGRLKFGLLRSYTKRQFDINSYSYAFPRDANIAFLNGQGLRNALTRRDSIYRDSGLTIADFTDEEIAASQAAAEDTSSAAYLFSDEPTELFSDAFTQPNRIGLGSFQNSWRWYLDPNERDTSYEAEQDLPSGYIGIELPVTQQLTFALGARAERTRIFILPTTDKEDDPQAATNPNFRERLYFGVDPRADGSLGFEGVSREEATVDFDESTWLRSAGLIYELAPEIFLRFNWSQTIARPSLTDLARTVDPDFIEGETIYGNPRLVISEVENLDLRWEWFRPAGQLLAVSWFRKDIEDPIEKVRTTVLDEVVFYKLNQESAVVRGIELEGRQSIGFLPLLDPLTIGANYTWLRTDVQVDDLLLRGLDFTATNGPDLTRNPIRQTDAPRYIFNLNIIYDNKDSGTTLGLFYNLDGEKLLSSAARTEDGGAIPEIYLLDVETLNLTFTQTFFEDWKFTFRARNLTDPIVKEKYRTPDGTENTRKAYRRGVEYSFGVGFSW